MTIIQDADNAESYVKLELYQPPTAHAELFNTALGRVVSKVDSLIPQFGLRNPRISIPDTLQYQFCIPDEWVASFWTGQLWHVQTVLEHPEWHDHDLGFLFSLSCVADYKLTGCERSRSMALRAADFLAARWRQPLPFVMCWNPMRRDDADFARRKVGTLNIDSMQGMALLYWAAKGQSAPADLHRLSCS